MSRDDAQTPGGGIVVYEDAEGGSRIRVLLEGETVWLTQRLLSDLYQVSVKTINEHLVNIYSEGEIDREATIRSYRIVQTEGKREVTRSIDHYNLDAILAVGYRVRSPRGVQFRQWATDRLREYLVKGFTLDDERLKGGSGLVDYFDELLARIREIRASEARVYQRIREIFSLACDYREGEEETKRFFATVQNKMHYGATGMTAAEIIKRRAASDEANMGLTAWKGGRVLKRDVVTAKNYLDAKEIDTLNRITVVFLDIAELRAERRQDIHMRDWEAFLDKFLRDTELPVLAGPGSVSRDAALDWANEQYDAFAQRRRIDAENEAEDRYVEDLRASAKQFESGRSMPDKKTAPRTKKGQGGSGKGRKS